MATVLFISKKGLAIIMPPKTKKDSLFLSTLVYCTEGTCMYVRVHVGRESTFMAAESAHREAT